MAISRHLEAAKFKGFWASNSDIENFFYGRFDGADQGSPKMAGTNSLRHHTACAMIYSAKATPDDEAIIKALRLDRDDIRAVREDEDVYQFVCRGAIRDPSYAGGYTVYVYDIGQAERLKTRLIEGGYTDVTTEPVAEAGILDVVRPLASLDGRFTTEKATETATEREVRLKAQDAQRKRDSRGAVKAAKIANGTYKGKGRPRSSPKPRS